MANEKKVVYNLEIKTDKGVADLKKLDKAGKGASTSLNQTAGSAELTNAALGKMPGGIQKVIGMFKTLFKVIIANPILAVIALVIAGITALGTAFMSTQRGADAFNKVASVTGVIIDKLIGKAQELSFALVDAFDDPKQALIDFGNFIKDQFMNRLHGIVSLGGAVKEIFSGNWSGAIDKLNDAVGEVTLGVSDMSGKMKEFAEETKIAVQQGQLLADLQVKIEESENDLILRRSELNLEYQKSLEIANDQSKSDEERKQAAQDAIEAQNELVEIEQEQIKRKLTKARIEASFNDTDRKAKAEIIKLQAKLNDLEAIAARKRKSGISLLNTVNKSIKRNADAARKALEKQQEAEQKAYDKKFGWLDDEKAIAEEEMAMDDLVLDNIVENIDAEIEAEKQKMEKIAALEEEERIRNAQAVENQKILREEALEKDIENINKVGDVMVDSLNMISDLQAQKNKERISNINSSYNDEVNLLKDKLDNGLLTEEEYNKKVYSLEVDRVNKENKILKAQFEQQKQTDAAKALIGTSLAVVNSMSIGMPWGAIGAAMAAAQGAVQMAIIASQQYTPVPLPQKAAGGGKLIGPLHAAGGINLGAVEAEGGEWVINRASSQKYEPLLNSINSAGNTNGDVNNVADIIDYKKLAAASQSKKVYVVSHDITDRQSKDTIVEDRVSF